VGECFFWYRPTRVVPDKRPLNGCVCVCVCVCVNRWRQRGSEKSPAATTWFTASSMKAAAFKEDSVRASFLPRDAPLAQECGTALSLSVTSRYCVKTDGRIELVFLSRKPRLTLHRILERNLCRNKGLPTPLCNFVPNSIWT